MSNGALASRVNGGALAAAPSFGATFDGDDVAGYYRNLSKRALGLTTQTHAFFAHNAALTGLVGIAPAATVVSGGNNVAGLTKRLRLNTTNTAGSRIRNVWVGADSEMPIVGGTNGVWFLVCKFQLLSATIDSAHVLGLSATTGSTNLFVMGVNGATSTSKFVLWCNAGTPITSTVTIDTSPHWVYAYRAGGKTFLYIDGVLQGSQTNLFPSLDAVPCYQAQSPTITTGTNIDFFFGGYGTNI